MKNAKAAKDDAAAVELTRDDVLAVLRRENPRAVPHDLVIYADAFMSYREAMENIARNGAIVAHPRTTAPIENPYLRVRDASVRILRGMKGIKTGDLWLPSEALEKNVVFSVLKCCAWLRNAL